MRKVAVVVNQDSGELAERWSAEFAEALQQPFVERGDEVRLWAGPGEGTEAHLQEALETNPDILLIAGGDGSVNSTAQRLIGSPVALGILPCGTLNIAARDLDIPLDPLDAARALAGGEVRPVDLLELAGEVSLCGVIFGVFPQLHRQDDEIHGSVWAKLGQVVRMVKSVTRGEQAPPQLGVRLLADEAGQGTEQLPPEPAQGIAVVSGSYRDRPGYLPLRLDPAEGVATLYRFRHQETLELVEGVLTWLRGSWEEDPQVDMLRGQAFEVSQEGSQTQPALVDGEDRNLPNPVTIKLLPKALRVLAPVPGGSGEGGLNGESAVVPPQSAVIAPVSAVAEPGWLPPQL